MEVQIPCCEKKTKHVPHYPAINSVKIKQAQTAAKNSWFYSQNKQLDKGKKIHFPLLCESGVWLCPPQSGLHARKQNVTTTAKGWRLLHTSPLTFPDFNSHNFPISLINPPVAVTHTTWALPSLLLVGGVGHGSTTDRNNFLFAHWHATTHGVVLGATQNLVCFCLVSQGIVKPGDSNILCSMDFSFKKTTVM